MTKKAELDKPASAIQPYDRNQQSFDDLLDGPVAEIQGYDLAKGDIADALEGVPFLVTRVTFRRGYPSRKEKGLWLAYVSLECVIGSVAYLKKRHVSLEDKPFSPEDHVIINDGSTGIQRQIVEFLEASGHIRLPAGPDSGAMEECRFDAPPSKWEDVMIGELSMTKDVTDPFMEYTTGMRLLAPRGLRISNYENDYTKEGKTRYLG